MLLSLLRRLRNCFLLRSDTWNIIFHLFAISSHSFFLLKSQDNLYESSSKELKDFVSLSTALWRTQLLWLGHSQNLIEFFWWCKRNIRSSLRIAAVWIWYGWNNRSKIFLAMWIESVMIMIFEILLWFVAWLIPHLIANSSASVLITLTTWWRVFMTGLLWMCVWDIDVTMLFLTLASVIISVCKGILKDSKAKLSSSWILLQLKNLIVS